MNIQKLFDKNPFQVSQKEKKIFFEKYIKSLTLHHINKCEEYKNIISNLKLDIKKIKNIEDFPMLPVNIFKSNNLKSVEKHQIVKTLTSSGTSGKNLSKIFLDKENANNQTRVLDILFTKSISYSRLPMIIIDKRPNLKDRNTFSAKSAAIFGFSIFGRKHFYLMNSKDEIDFKGLDEFLTNYGNGKFLIFGFTSFIYENLIQKLAANSKKYNLKNGIVLHGGGWKKLEKIKVNDETLKRCLKKEFLIDRVQNYYGLVEQTGSIFIQSEKCGFFHTSIFSEILIRNNNFDIVKNKTKGLIQLVSLLPTSYPGHNILTEDIGEIIGVDNCKCGLKGKYFLIHGRAKQAEVRGCSDVS